MVIYTLNDHTNNEELMNWKKFLNFKKFLKRKIIAPESVFDIVISNYENLDINRFKGVYSSDYSNFSVISPKDNILSYIEMLKTFNNKLENDSMIDQSSIPREFKNIYLFDFFLDEKGNYIDAKLYIERFRDEVIRLLRSYQTIENKLDRSFNEGKNLLYLQEIVSNLIQNTGVLIWQNTEMSGHR